MRLASFFLISITLHAFALVYPVSFADPKQAQLIRVMILPPVEHETSGANGQDGGSGSRASRAGAKAPGHVARALQNLVQSNQTGSPEPRPQFGEAPLDLNENNSAALVFVPAKSGEADGAAKIPLAGDDGTGSDKGAIGNGANGFGSSGSGAGLGNGQGSSGNGAVLIQARYSETPKPVYPESARSEGREGQVILRVLVDDQGRSKHVEINRSSGSEALDRAAAEAIKRWRFIPARYGDKAVESWIRIPIEFRLADAKP